MKLLHLVSIYSVASIVLNHLLSAKDNAMKDGAMSKANLSPICGLKYAKKAVQICGIFYGRGSWNEWHRMTYKSDQGR